MKDKKQWYIAFFNDGSYPMLSKRKLTVKEAFNLINKEVCVDYSYELGMTMTLRYISKLHAMDCSSKEAKKWWKALMEEWWEENKKYHLPSFLDEILGDEE